MLVLGSRLGVSASVPVFSTDHSETGLEKSLERGWCLRILISLLVGAKQSCFKVHGGTVEEHHGRHNGPVSFCGPVSEVLGEKEPSNPLCWQVPIPCSPRGCPKALQPEYQALIS